MVLVEMGSSLDELDEQGHTPLHWAVFGGYTDIVQILLRAGAKPNTFSDDGVTPRWRARDFGLLEIEELLALYGGRIDTNENSNGVAFQLFNNLIDSSSPQVEKQIRGNSFVTKLVQRVKQILGVSPVK